MSWLVPAAWSVCYLAAQQLRVQKRSTGRLQRPHGCCHHPWRPNPLPATSVCACALRPLLCRPPSRCKACRSAAAAARMMTTSCSGPSGRQVGGRTCVHLMERAAGWGLMTGGTECAVPCRACVWLHACFRLVMFACAHWPRMLPVQAGKRGRAAAARVPWMRLMRWTAAAWRCLLRSWRLGRTRARRSACATALSRVGAGAGEGWVGVGRACGAGAEEHEAQRHGCL